jgi:hypothetical protein
MMHKALSANKVLSVLKEQKITVIATKAYIRVRGCGPHSSVAELRLRQVNVVDDAADRRIYAARRKGIQIVAFVARISNQPVLAAEKGAVVVQVAIRCLLRAVCTQCKYEAAFHRRSPHMRGESLHFRRSNSVDVQTSKFLPNEMVIAKGPIYK